MEKLLNEEEIESFDETVEENNNSDKQKKYTGPAIKIKKGCYYCYDKRITNFIVEDSSKIEGEDTAEVRLKLRTNHGELVELNIPTSSFASVSSLKAELNKTQMALTYTASGNYHEILKSYIWKNIPNKILGVKASGIYFRDDESLYVEGEKAVDKNGREVNSIRQLNSSVGIKSDILNYSEPDKEAVKELMISLLLHNEPGITFSIASWIGAAFLKTHLKALGYKLPHLCIAGEAGSGKSTILESIIIPVFSEEGAKAAGQIKQFASLKDAASSKLCPMIIDEYKPKAIRNTWLINDFLRNSYDGHESERGRPDLSVVHYRFESPVVLCGESSPQETAIRERMILAILSKTKKPEHSYIMNYLKAHEYELHQLGRLFLNTALNTELKDVENWYTMGVTRCGKEFPPRVINNLACLFAGICLAKKAVLDCGLSWEDITKFSPDQVMEVLKTAMKENLLDGRDTNMSIIDETFEIFARMGLVENQDYIIRIVEGGKKQLCIRLSTIYDRYTRYRRDYNIDGEYLSKDEFRKQLKRSDYLIDSNAVVRFPTGSRSDEYKCWIIDFDKLSERCDVSGFEAADRAVSTQTNI